MPTSRRTLLVALLLAVWFGGVALLSYNHTGATGDLAEYVNNPVRLLYGEWPYRDFWLLHPPGEVLLPAAIYRLGLGVNGVLLATAGLNVLAGLAAFSVARNVTGADADGALAGFLVFFVGVPALYWSYVSLQADFLCALAAAAMFVEFLRRGQRRWLLAAGIAIGLAACFKFYLAGAAGAAMFAALICDARKRRRSLGDAAKDLGVYVGGGLLAPTALAACLADLWPQMWRAVLLDSVVHATSVPRFYGYKLAEFWNDTLQAARDFRQQPWPVQPGWITSPSRLLAMTALHALPFAAAGLWLVARKRGALADTVGGGTTCFFLLWGGFGFVRGYSSGGNTCQLIQATTPLYFVLVFLLRPLLERARTSKRLNARLAALTAVTLVATLAQVAPAETLAHLAKLKTGRHPIVAPHGTLMAAAADYASDMQGLIDEVLRRTEPGERIFVTAWSAPPLYALTGRRNPTYYDSLVDLCHRPSDEKQRRVCRELLSSPTQLVVHRAGWQFSSQRFEKACPLIDACLREHFEPVAQCGPHCILQRRQITAGLQVDNPR
ncbi:MAG: glycosyltransferase family 39 protein [Planctomycetaceae bacterium]